MQMSWEVGEASRIIEMHHLLDGVNPKEAYEAIKAI